MAIVTGHWQRIFSGDRYSAPEELLFACGYSEVSHGLERPHVGGLLVSSHVASETFQKREN